MRSVLSWAAKHLCFALDICANRLAKEGLNLIQGGMITESRTDGFEGGVYTCGLSRFVLGSSDTLVSPSTMVRTGLPISTKSRSIDFAERSHVMMRKSSVIAMNIWRSLRLFVGICAECDFGQFGHLGFAFHNGAHRLAKAGLNRKNELSDIQHHSEFERGHTCRSRFFIWQLGHLGLAFDNGANRLAKEGFDLMQERE